MRQFFLPGFHSNLKHCPLFNLSMCFRYGDKSPKSYIARIFAVLWILLGITIFSMFTASLTNRLHRASWGKNSVEVNGKTVTHFF